MVENDVEVTYNGYVGLSMPCKECRVCPLSNGNVY